MAEIENDENPENHPSLSDCEEDELAPFAPVLAVVRLDAVPDAASRLWDTHNPHDPLARPPVVGAPLHGSYNILFPVEFGCRGVRWLLKVPISGTPDHWDTLSADELESEARTMQLIRQRTSIPLPEVFGFCSSLDNSLGCPHIWLSFISGDPLPDFWFAQDLDISDEEHHRRRTRVLRDIAAAMVQLGQFTFDTGGRLLFDSAGSPSGIGRRREMDHDESFRRRMQDDPDHMPVYYASGPFKTATEFYTAALSRAPPAESDYLLGGRRLLDFFVDCATDFFAADARSFVLTHPDLGFQNFLVSPEGRLVGIIDWEGVAAQPTSLGNLRYPSWLTRDWDPSMYGYGSDNVPIHPDIREDSPGTLALCRKIYQEAVRDALVEQGSQPGNQVYLTSASLITESLAIAAGVEGFRRGILDKIVKEIAAVVPVPCSETYEGMLCLELYHTLGRGELGKDTRDALRAGMEILLRNTSL
jgi:hypothetical protein